MITASLLCYVYSKISEWFVFANESTNRRGAIYKINIGRYLYVVQMLVGTADGWEIYFPDWEG